MKVALVGIFLILAQGKKPQPISDVSSPQTFEEKAYEAKGDLTISAAATFAEGAVVYLPAEAQVRVRANVALEGDVTKPVVFVAAKGKAWKGLVVEKAATVKGTRLNGRMVVVTKLVNRRLGRADAAQWCPQDQRRYCRRLGDDQSAPAARLTTQQNTPDLSLSTGALRADSMNGRWVQ